MFNLRLVRKIRLGKPAARRPVVVVEIGNDWLKIAEVTPLSRGIFVNKMAFTKLAQIKGTVAESLSAVIKDLKLAAQPVITYVPRHLVTVRILRFPSTNPKEIADMVSLQVGKQTPYSKQEITSVYKVIDAEDQGYSRVMLVIARHSLIDERLEVLRGAGLEIESVGVSSEGAFDWFKQVHLNQQGPDKGDVLAGEDPGLRPLVLLDIDSNYSDFMVVHKQNLAFTRSILIGANHLLEERDKWQDKFLEEIRRSIELYQSEEGAGAPQRMFLSGAAVKIKDLDVILGVKLGLPVVSLDPLSRVKIKNSAFLQDNKFNPLSLSSLIGMPLARGHLDIDLTPDELRIQRSTEEKRRHLTRMGILLIALVVSGSLWVVINIYNKTAYLSRLRQNISRIEKASDEIEKMRLRIDLVERRLDAKGTSLDIFYQIHKLVPREIYFTTITIDEKKQAVLRGRAFVMSDVFKFVTTLENSSYFENVKTTYTTTKKDEGREYAEFEVICSYEK